MKVRGNRPVDRTQGVSASDRRPRASASEAISRARMPADAASIMGIPEAELTPSVRSAMMTLMEEVDSLRQELEIAKGRIEELSSLADQDALLPDILNRRAFIREMSRVMSFAERYDMDASLIYFDLKGFKAVNDTHGHAAGDKVLRMVGQVLRSNVRDSDVVGRLGGDEFGVVLAKASEEIALKKAGALAKEIQSTSVDVAGGEKVSVDCSFGAYTFKDGLDPEAAMDAADKAMYGKRNGDRETS